MGESAVELHILHNIKLPILLTAVLVGSALAMGSAALQVTLNNPLADPGIIGISSGASLMAAIFLVLFSALGTMPQAFLYQYSVFLLPLFCFIGACLSGALIYVVAKKIGHSVASFILAGIAISTVFSAVVGWIYLSAPPQALQSLTFWLMGSLSYTNYYSLLVAGALIVLALVSLLAMPKQLNLLYLGESAAKSAGVNTKTQQRKIFIIVAILVGVSVSIAGSVAFLGLLVPHAIRRLHGYDNKQVLVYSALLGSSVLLCCAIINEYLFSTAVPLSMLTASIGAPLFIYVLFANKLG
jgi:iron complex transport system permease protein